MKRYGLIVLGVLSLAAVILVDYFRGYEFDKGCGDYLKLAGDAPNIEQANKFLGQALTYIEKNHLNKGNSAWIRKTPSSDLSIWRNKIRGAKITVGVILTKEAGMKATAAPEASLTAPSIGQLEKDNALMKVREVLLDEGKSGTVVTLPAHISLYPYQYIFLFWWIVTAVLLAAGGLVWYSGGFKERMNEEYKKRRRDYNKQR